MASDFKQDQMIDILRSIDQKLEVLMGYIVKAESEVPEYLRRFMMYYSDLAHHRWLYDSLGLPISPDVNKELERAHDRLGHILEDENQQGGTFQRIRGAMRERGGTKYSHGDRR